eukprot:73185-Lingulodinium_polyedra.AAC.1
MVGRGLQRGMVLGVPPRIAGASTRVVRHRARLAKVSGERGIFAALDEGVNRVRFVRRAGSRGRPLAQ